MANRITSPSTSQPNNSTANIPHDKIAKRAYEKWCNRGRPQGTDQQDWMEAEAELHAEAARMGQTGSPMHNQGMQTQRPVTAGQTRR